MGHITSKSAYKSLEERINWFTQGAPASDTFYKILQVQHLLDEDGQPVTDLTLERVSVIDEP